MSKIAFLTCKKLTDWVAGDAMLKTQLEKEGFDVSLINWDDKVIWSDYEAIIFRSTWDYFERESEFMAFLNDLKSKEVRIFNSIEVIEENIHKFYLQSMEADGINIIPSVFINKNDDQSWKSLIPSDWYKMVVKPAFSGGSYLTEKFSFDQIDEVEQTYLSMKERKDLILQKYMDEIENEGEVSLVFFDKKFSHAIVKTPKQGDFRIQSQFGGHYQSFEPSQALVDEAGYILQRKHENLLYARVDGIVSRGKFYLMELELIEPDLFLQFKPEAAKDFVSALKRIWNA